MVTVGLVVYKFNLPLYFQVMLYYFIPTLEIPYIASYLHFTNSDFCAIVILLLSVFSSVKSFSCVRPFVTPWTAARQASLSFPISQSLLKLMSTELVMPSNHLVLCRPLLFLPSIFPSMRVFARVGSSHQVAKVVELQLQYQSFQ